MRIYRIILILVMLLASFAARADEFTDSIRALPAHKAASGIIVTGRDSLIRAFSAFGSDKANGTAYAKMINHYADTLAGKVRVYSMVIPTAVAYYCPDTARTWTLNEFESIAHVRKCLDSSVCFVGIDTVLMRHAAEPIYLRTDHHWAPLAAYYAAGEFARAAHVPFRCLDAYDTLTVKNFVGTMYKFSKDISVKRSPEDFVYYVPRDTAYTTSFIIYNVARGGRVVGESGPVEGSFFKHYKDGSGAAYCTFMGGDTRTVHVKTSQHNARRLLIIKDSFGNALPGYLFGSFEEIHVADFRYFSKNILQYISDNKITDLLFANNLVHAFTRSTAKKCEELLTK